jgi:glycolate oxidase iron-sulfur subunit
MFKDTPAVRDQIKKCVRCGKCRSVCPIFNEYRTENYSPRGQVFMVQMLRDGVLFVSDKVAAKLGDCLMCESCSSNCPSAIPVPELVAEARAFITEQRPSTSKKLIFEKLWTNPGLLRNSVAAAGLADSLGLRSLARSLGLTGILPGDLPRAEKILGKIPRRSARSQLSAVIPARGTRKTRVAYFLGCGTDLLQPEIALATAEVLTHCGCEVIIPPDLKCCGVPHLANGAKTVAEELVIHNLNILSKLGVDAIISDCASCTSTLKGHLYRPATVIDKLRNSSNSAPTLAEKTIEAANWLKGKVFDLTVFLVDELGLPTEIGKLMNSVVVTYHDPCHLVKAQKIKNQPRKILQSIPGVDFQEMVGADTCCGGSGTFGLTHYDLSMKILKRKIENIQKSGAEILATSCPSCTTQISYGLREAGLDIKVLHPVQLLQKALIQH